MNQGSLLPQQIEDLLNFHPDSLKVKSKEGKHLEFKETFTAREFPRYTKTLAAFSNTAGGTLIFGIADKPRRITGLKTAECLQEAAWTDQLRSSFDPEIPIEIEDYQINNLNVVAVGVERHPNAPVICKKDMNIEHKSDHKSHNKAVLQNGSIYYRYYGQTRPIAFSELSALLQSRFDRHLNSILENLKMMQRIGPDRIAMVDVSQSDPVSQGSNLFLTRDTAKFMNFIKKGHFVQSSTEGSPAYVDAGQVTLNRAIEVPLSDDERILPSEAVDQLKPVIKELYGREVPFGPSHLCKLAKNLGLRNRETSITRYCVVDQKLDRVFYRPEGIRYIESRLREDPRQCLLQFASRDTINRVTPVT